MTLGVEIVICENILNSLYTNDKYNAFLKHWLAENETKAVVTLYAWKNFMEAWETKLRDTSDEIKNPFFASIKGIATPYRQKYGAEAAVPYEEIIEDDDTELSPIEELVKIVNRHYETVKFLIVENPETYTNMNGLQIEKDRIVSLKGFYNSMEILNNGFVQNFKKNIFVE